MRADADENMPSLQSWMTAVAAGVLLLLALAVAGWLRRRRRRPAPLPTQWGLSGRPVFSSDERKVYRHLREALPHHIVLAKVPLVRFSQPDDPQRVRYWFDLLGGIHVTFAVCSANGRVLVAFDLDTERSTGSQRTQQIKENVLAACKIRYLRIPLERLPSAHELQLLVPQSSAAARAPQPAPATAASAAEVAGAAGRRDRRTLWQDSSFFQDSFFGSDARGDAGSEFGALGDILRGGAAAPAARRRPDGESGGAEVGPGQTPQRQ